MRKMRRPSYLVLVTLFPLVLGSTRSATFREQTWESSEKLQKGSSGEAGTHRRRPSPEKASVDRRDQQHSHRSSRDHPAGQSSTHRRRHRRKKRHHRRFPTCDQDPMDWSSSSFVPLTMFSDDEQEENILSALAQIEESDQEEEKEAVRGKKHTRVRHAERKSRTRSPMIDGRGVACKTEDTALSRTKQTVSEGHVYSKSTAHRRVQGCQANVEKAGRVSTQEEHRPKHQPATTVLEIRGSAVPANTSHTHGSAMPRSQASSASTLASPVIPPPHLTHPPRAENLATTKTTSSTTTWVRRFLSTRPRDALLPVPREYLSDGFNLVQLAPIVERIAAMDEGYAACLTNEQKENRHAFPLFKAALKLILLEDEPSLVPVTVQKAAEVLYTLVHARYILSPRGLETVRRVLQGQRGVVEPVFGKCPRIPCRGMPLLPLGDSDDFDYRGHVSTRAKRFCPCCGEVRGRSTESSVHQNGGDLHSPNQFHCSYCFRNFTCGIARLTRAHGGVPFVTCSS
jgi:hypothetical protein